MPKRNNKAICRLETALSEFCSIGRIRKNKPPNQVTNESPNLNQTYFKKKLRSGFETAI